MLRSGIGGSPIPRKASLDEDFQNALQGVAVESPKAVGKLFDGLMGAEGVVQSLITINSGIVNVSTAISADRSCLKTVEHETQSCGTTQELRSSFIQIVNAVVLAGVRSYAHCVRGILSGTLPKRGRISSKASLFTEETIMTSITSARDEITTYLGALDRLALDKHKTVYSEASADSSTCAVAIDALQKYIPCLVKVLELHVHRSVSFSLPPMSGENTPGQAPNNVVIRDALGDLQQVFWIS